MRATVITRADPFGVMFKTAPGRPEVQCLRRPRRIRTLAPKTRLPVIAVLNGRPLLRAGWRRRLRDGDVLEFQELPLGGGGGRGGSNPVQVLMSIALMAVAGPLGSVLGGASFATAFSSAALLTNLGRAAVLVGGGLLLGAMGPGTPKRGGAAEEIFALSPQGNIARLEQPIPVQYGRMRFAPDFAAQPHSEAQGNELFVYCLYCLGAGEYEVEDITIGDADLDAFGEVDYEVIPPGGQVTLFPTAVETSDLISGQELRARVTLAWSRSGTTVTVDEPDHRRATGQAVRVEVTGGGPVTETAIAAVPDEDHWTFTVSGWAPASGSAQVYLVVGGDSGVPLCGAGQSAVTAGVDLLWPGGLYGVAGDGGLKSRTTVVLIEARQIDDAGTAIGSWVTLGTETLSGKTRTAQRRSYRYSLPLPGRWALRARRTNAEAGGESDAEAVLWSGLRGYLVETQDWPEVTLLAMRMRATGNLSRQASRQVNVTATRRLPRWTGSAWTAPEATRSIAWAIADAARNDSYGPGLADSAIDLEALLALDALWASRGDVCDIRLTSSGSWWDAVGRIAVAGRARPYLQGGILRVVRDGPVDLPVAMFSQRNIVEGSFSLDWVFTGPRTVDAVEVVYLDANTWQPERLRCALPGSIARRPAKLMLDTTVREQALREGMYHAAEARYRRRFGKFQTEMEGFIPSFGDLILVQHDLVGWGAQAEAVAWTPGTRQLVLSEPMVWIEGASHVVALRRRDGSPTAPIAVTRGAADSIVLLGADPGITPDIGLDRERTHVSFGTAEAWGARCKVGLARAIDERHVEIEFVVEDPAVHTAETGRTPPPLVQGRLPRLPEAPVVRDLKVVLSPDAIAFVSWQPAPGAVGYLVEVAEGGATSTVSDGWVRVGETAVAELMLRPPYGPRTRFRVCAIGRRAGPWAVAQAGVARPVVWLTREDTGLEVLWARRATDVVWANLTDTLWTALLEEDA
jgi:hypothetical protein